MISSAPRSTRRQVGTNRSGSARELPDAPERRVLGDTGRVSMLGSEWPLTGRDDELGLLTRSLVDDRLGVVIVGPAGVGKTRLAAAAVDELLAAGCEHVRVVGLASQHTVPFAALSPVIGLAQSEAFGVDRWMHIQRVLEARALGAARFVLVVDDAHLLDEQRPEALTGGLTRSPTRPCFERSRPNGSRSSARMLCPTCTTGSAARAGSTTRCTGAEPRRRWSKTRPARRRTPSTRALSRRRRSSRTHWPQSPVGPSPREPAGEPAASCGARERWCCQPPGCAAATW